MKNRNYKQLLIVLTMLVGGFSLTACKDEFDELSGGAENLQFTQLMEASLYASADYLIMSENSQNIIISQRDEGTSYTNYFSVDGGQSFELMNTGIGNNGSGSVIDDYLSNDGKFILRYQNNKTVFQLKPGEAYNAVLFASNVFALTADGKVISYQFDETIGQNTYFIYENDAYVSTGVRNIMDPAISFAGTSGSKIGFFSNNTLAEFDVITKQYTERPAVGGNYANPDKSKGIQTAYSEGYFAYANGAGVTIISPSKIVNLKRYIISYETVHKLKGLYFTPLLQYSSNICTKS